MSQLPLISIIIPVFNVEPYLNKCITSVVNQTYDNLEIILVDDGSPDHCPKMCDEWAEKDARIKVIHKPNGGVSSARNAGLDIAGGAYIMYTDSDDWIEPDMAEFLYTNITRYHADIAQCGFFEADSDSTPDSADHTPVILEGEDRIIDLVSNSYCSGVAWNKLYRADRIKGIYYNIEYGCSEDLLHNFQVIDRTKRTVFVNVPKYHYVTRQNSITQNIFNEHAFDIVRAKKIILNSQTDNPNTLPHCIKSFVQSSFIVLSGVITNQKCLDRYEELRGGILAYKKDIFCSGLYTFKDIFKTLVLWTCPKLYNLIIIHTKP